MISHTINSNLRPNNAFLRFLLPLFLFSLSIFSSKAFGQFTCPDPARCTSKDLEVVDAFIQGVNECLTCTPGDTVTGTLRFSIYNKTGSVRTSFALFGTISGTTSNGPISICGGPIDPMDTTTIGSTQIKFVCGSEVKLTDVFLAWTDAAGNTATRCQEILADKCKSIAPKCGTVAEIIIRTPLTAVASDSTRPCAGTNTGSLTFKASGGTSPYSYTLSGGTLSSPVTNTTGVFTGLGAGTYSLTVTDAKGCKKTISYTLTAIPKPAKPTLQVTQPTCTASTGCITVTAPTGTGLSYSLNGGTYQSSAQFCNLAAGKYCISVKNSSGCISDTACATVNSAPTKPAKPTLQVTQPTCTVSTGCIKVTAPTGTGYSYSLNGGTYQTGVEFCNLAPGKYCISAKIGECVSDTACATVNSAPSKPAKPTLQVTQPTCTVSTGCIKVTAPVGTGYSYSLNGGTYQTSAEFCGLAPGTYCISAKLGDCVSDTACAKLVAPVCQFAGCTPGFWKNTRTRWDQPTDAVSQCIASATSATFANDGTLNASFEKTFGLTDAQMTAAGLPTNLTLIQALNLGGGGCYKLARHAVAALLNSCALKTTKYSYTYTTAQVLQMTHDAIASKTCEPTASKFAAANETGTCPLSSDGNADKTITSSKPIEPGQDAEVSTLSVSVNPNPYSSIIRFVIKSPVSGTASLDLFNVLGQKLHNVYTGHIDAGNSKTIDFNVPPSIRTNLIYKLVLGGRYVSGRVMKQ